MPLEEAGAEQRGAIQERRVAGAVEEAHGMMRRCLVELGAGRAAALRQQRLVDAERADPFADRPAPGLGADRRQDGRDRAAGGERAVELELPTSERRQVEVGVDEARDDPQLG
jgi:hypothetical protein